MIILGICAYNRECSAAIVKFEVMNEEFVW
jgi:hypothetical protein